MRLNQRKVIQLIVAGLLCQSGQGSTVASAQSFTVADEIALAHFGDPYTLQAEAVLFSPDGNYFAIDTERGRLDLNRPEDSLRFYHSQDVEDFLKRSDESLPPSPIWVVNRSTDNQGPIIRDWRWLADSSGVAFLEREAGGNQRLVFADLRKKSIEPLTSAIEEVKSFDVRDRDHYVYTVADPDEQNKLQNQRQAPGIVGTGRSSWELLFPDDVRFLSPRSHLWAVIGGDRRFEVKHDGVPIVLFDRDLALSPDGRSLVTKLPVPEVPSSWEILYPPPFASSPYRIHAGHQEMQSGKGSVRQYVRIDLQTGSVQALTDAPVDYAAGWFAAGKASWSTDGKEILLPGTFIATKDNSPSRPCVAVVDMPTNSRTCVEILKGHTETGVEEGYHLVWGARFAGTGKQRVMVSFIDHSDRSFLTTEYQRATDGDWQVAGEIKGIPQSGRESLEVTVNQGLNEPPRLVGTNKKVSRVIWDPNPQLRNFELGPVSVYKWKDKEGREWRGGLYKPSNYKPGQRYPLVIQTHGFLESEFRPSGLFPTAFAARALASAGIIVLQVIDDDGCPLQTPGEGSCAVSDYEAAANQLVSEGLVDPERMGIIGFSRTCFYVMEALTTSSLHFKAASITDGVMEDYFQYILGFSKEADPMIGAAPFGEGLQLWLKRSPGFNLDKVNAPLLVVGEGPASLLLMWEPYAGLYYLHKPVDLVMLNTDEHVLSNPAVRMASQGGSVDWFRFWLQDYEDPDPVKKEQYERWRGLKKMQEENDAKGGSAN